MVLVHGLTFSCATWRPVARRLTDRFRCVSVDLPGHGDSPGPAGTPDRAADALRRTLHRLGVERPVVAGHSLGAMVALAYAAGHPSAGLVTVDQPLQVRAFGELVARLAPALRGPGFAEAFEPFQRSIGIDALPEPTRTEVYATQTIRQDVVVASWADLLDGGVDSVQAQIDRATAALDVPYLAVFGAELPEDQRAYLRRQVPRAEIAEWPGRGHLVHLADPDAFAERLAAFVGTATVAQ